MKDVNYRRIPNCLKKYRRILGYTQKQVATILGVQNSSMISRWENGQRLPSSINIFKLSALYRTMVDALYRDLGKVLRQEVDACRNKIFGKNEGM